METNGQGEERRREPGMPRQEAEQSREARELRDTQQAHTQRPPAPDAPRTPSYQPPVQAAQAGKAEHAWLKPVAIGLLVVAVGIGSFFGGMAVSGDDHPNQVAVGGTGQGDQAGPEGQTVPGRPDGNMEGTMPGRMGAMGEVTAVSSSSISVEDTRSGEAGTYGIDGSTEIMDEGEAAEVGDIQVGDNVMVVPSDTDESVAARIIVNPAMGGPGGPGGQGATPPGDVSQPDTSDSTST